MPRDASPGGEPQSSVGAESQLRPAPMVPGKNGHGLLRVGNPGNKGNKEGNRSAIARGILEASTPQAAAVLKQMSLEGTVGRGKKKRPLSDQDRLKAVTAHLDRGGAPAVSAIAAAAGTGFLTIAVGAQTAEADPLTVPAGDTTSPSPSLSLGTLPLATTHAGAIPGSR